MEEKALYACDQCYRCKTRCEKELPRCRRCRKQNSTCTYSVAGSAVLTLDLENTNGQTIGALMTREQGQDRQKAAHEWTKPPERELKPATSNNHAFSSYCDTNMRDQIVTSQAQPSVMITPQNSCHCVHENLKSTRAVYLGSIQWDNTRDMASLQQGILSCEPCLDCSTARRKGASVSSLLFLERALMCMTQATFPPMVAYGANGLLSPCQTTLLHLQNTFNLDAVDDGDAFRLAARLLQATQEAFAAAVHVTAQDP